MVIRRVHRSLFTHFTVLLLASAALHSGQSQAQRRSFRCPYEVTNPHALTETLRGVASKGILKTVQNLVECGADVNAEDSDNGNTALHYAALFGHHKTVAYLIRSGADINRSNYKSNTPLMYASEFCHLRTLEQIIPHSPDPNVQDAFGSTALIHAASKGCAKAVAYLLALEDIRADHQDDFYKTALDYSEEMRVLEVEGPYTMISYMLLEHSKRSSKSSAKIATPR